MNATPGYNRTQIRLHWVVAVLIVLQYMLNEPIAALWEARQAGEAGRFSLLVPLHVFGGLAVVALALWRLGLRSLVGAPLPPPGNPLAAAVATWTHRGLYAAMVLMPLSGAVAWFGDVDAAALAHNILKVLLLVLVAVHLAGALFHHFVLRDGLLLRMTRAAR